MKPFIYTLSALTMMLSVLAFGLHRVDSAIWFAIMGTFFLSLGKTE